MKTARVLAVYALLAAALAAVFIASVGVGSVSISASDTLDVLFGRGGDGALSDIILKIRLPRAVISVVLGGALAMAGYLLQTFFGNPIAGPFVLGISSGAKFFVACAMVFSISAFGSLSSLALICTAFAGSLTATAFVLLVSRRVSSMAALLVAGVMIGYICSAATDFIITFADDAQIVSLRGWSLGSFSGANWSSVRTSIELTFVGAIGALLLAKQIGAYQLGEAHARSVGLNVRRFRTALLAVSSLLSATVTAFAGPISFVGVAVPFIAKSSLGTSRPFVVMPAVWLGGALFCCMCDLIARTVFAPTELNISTVTAIFGAPVVMFMLIKRSGRR